MNGTDDRDAELQRLRRQVRRERAARLEAEQIAERGMLDLYEANRALDRRVAERTAELERARERAERADRAKSEFLANLGHEVSTPLHGIVGLLPLIVERADDPELRSLVDGAVRSAERLNRVISSTLDYATFERDEAVNRPTGTTLLDLADAIGDRWRRRAAASGCLLVVETGPDPHAAAEVDIDHLDRIVDALVENATVFGPGGTVNVTVEQTAGILRIGVTDEGPGLPALEAERAFEPFVQLEGSSTRAVGGAGLGLALARRTAQFLGGEVTFDGSTGSTFVATVPSGAPR